MYKLSIVIPVYNAENCLDNAIESIINQTIGFENIELILVDDKSSDNSKNIILDYSNKFENIIPFFADKNHGFPGYGRNVGIDNSSSKYIMFMDNDDELDLQMCEKLYDAIEKYDADISCCDIKEIDDSSEVLWRVGPKNREGECIISQGEELFEYHTGFVWNKLFKKEIIDKFQIKFLSDNYCDDQAFSVEYILHSNKLAYLKDYGGYFWLRRNESLSNSKKLENLMPLFSGYEYIFDVAIKNNKNLIRYISDLAIGYLIGQSVLLKSPDERKMFLEKIHDFEVKYGINAKLYNPFFSLANLFILKRRYNIASSILSVYSKLNHSSFLKILYAKIYG